MKTNIGIWHVENVNNRNTDNESYSNAMRFDSYDKGKEEFNKRKNQQIPCYFAYSDNFTTQFLDSN